MGARNLKKLAAVSQAAEMVLQRLEERRMLSVTLDQGTWTIDTEDDRNHVISVDVNAANTDGRTALDAAKAARYDSVVKFLLEKGAKQGQSGK